MQNKHIRRFIISLIDGQARRDLLEQLILSRCTWMYIGRDTRTLHCYDILLLFNFTGIRVCSVLSSFEIL